MAKKWSEIRRKRAGGTMDTQEQQQAIKGEMAILDRTGDTKIIWDRNNADEVANARRTFNDLKAKGYLAFKVTDKDGNKGDQIREFDPAVERMILTPPMRGG